MYFLHTYIHTLSNLEHFMHLSHVNIKPTKKCKLVKSFQVNQNITKAKHTLQNLTHNICVFSLGCLTLPPQSTR